MSRDLYLSLEDRASRERMAIGRNVAENGRWGVLALVACALAGGSVRMGVCFALVLLGAYVVEQLPAPWRHLGALALAAYTITILASFILLVARGA